MKHHEENGQSPDFAKPVKMIWTYIMKKQNKFRRNKGIRAHNPGGRVKITIPPGYMIHQGENIEQGESFFTFFAMETDGAPVLRVVTVTILEINEHSVTVADSMAGQVVIYKKEELNGWYKKKPTKNRRKQPPN